MTQLDCMHNTYIYVSENADIEKLKQEIHNYTVEHGFDAYAETLKDEFALYVGETKYLTKAQTALAIFISALSILSVIYRVSTDKQLYYTEENDSDIPMQRIRCHAFCEQMGWTIVCELQEEGVSGHKVRAEKRDKIQLIKDYAKQGRFDILLVFMFDRLGRIADETPFLVEWFVRNGIRVWSTQEGEQRFESHADKLMNYIRFWQADGESEKTSIRTSNSMGILTEQGCYTGGRLPYGYQYVKMGRTNKRKQ